MSDAYVDDIRLGDGSELYLVHPKQPNGAAVLFLHWFDEAPNANRAQFLDEAKTLAAVGVTSALPQLAFPWHSAPTDAEDDLRRIEAEVGKLREACALLDESEGVERIGLVGHDFGAMHGMQLFGNVALNCAVVIAAVPRWSDWFLPFWRIASDRYDYMRQLSHFDPITAVGRADMPLLFQFGNADFYIAPMTAQELYAAAPEPKQMVSYESGHAMESEDIRDERLRFLAEHLSLDLTRTQRKNPRAPTL